jgi:hypothetical protein
LIITCFAFAIEHSPSILVFVPHFTSLYQVDVCTSCMRKNEHKEHKLTVAECSQFSVALADEEYLNAPSMPSSVSSPPLSSSSASATNSSHAHAAAADVDADSGDGLFEWVRVVVDERGNYMRDCIGALVRDSNNGGGIGDDMRTGNNNADVDDDDDDGLDAERALEEARLSKAQRRTAADAAMQDALSECETMTLSERKNMAVSERKDKGMTSSTSSASKATVTVESSKSPRVTHTQTAESALSTSSLSHAHRQNGGSSGAGGGRGGALLVQTTTAAAAGGGAASESKMRRLLSILRSTGDVDDGRSFICFGRSYAKVARACRNAKAFSPFLLPDDSARTHSSSSSSSAFVLCVDKSEVPSSLLLQPSHSWGQRQWRIMQALHAVTTTTMTSRSSGGGGGGGSGGAGESLTESMGLGRGTHALSAAALLDQLSAHMQQRERQRDQTMEARLRKHERALSHLYASASASEDSARSSRGVSRATTPASNLNSHRRAHSHHRGFSADSAMSIRSFVARQTPTPLSRQSSFVVRSATVAM